MNGNRIFWDAITMQYLDGRTILHDALMEMGIALKNKEMFIKIDKAFFKAAIQQANNCPPGYPLRRDKAGRMMRRGK